MLERRDARLRQLEGGCRVLKQQFEKASDHRRQQQFYRFELIARRAQRSTPWPERALSYTYEKVSNYGASFVRPLVALVLAALLFALPYAAVDAGVQPGAPVDWNALGHALEFSLARVFPFGAFEVVSKSWFDELAKHRDLGWVVAVRAVATVQSVLALVLVFLFALAVRRRFQIT